MIFCKDCKWFRTYFRDYYCHHPSTYSDPNIATGYVDKTGAIAEAYRTSHCGVDTPQYYKPKLWKRLKDWLKNLHSEY